MRLDICIIPQVGLISHKICSYLSHLVGATSESTSTALPNERRSERIRIFASRFRILIIGRANAGKTTILQKVCNTVDQPEILDANGKKVHNRTQKKVLMLMQYGSSD